MSRVIRDLAVIAQPQAALWRYGPLHGAISAASTTLPPLASHTPLRCVPGQTNSDTEPTSPWINRSLSLRFCPHSFRWSGELVFGVPPLSPHLAGIRCPGGRVATTPMVLILTKTRKNATDTPHQERKTQKKHRHKRLIRKDLSQQPIQHTNNSHPQIPHINHSVLPALSCPLRPRPGSLPATFSQAN